MKSGRLFRVHNRLGDLIRRPGGKSVQDALEAADARVRAKHEDMMSRIPLSAAKLKDLTDQTGRDDFARLDAIYIGSNQIFASAVAIGLEPLADAAYALCDLVTQFRESGDTNWNAIRVHVDAIRVLAQRSSSETPDDVMTQALRALGTHFVSRARDVKN